MVANVITYKRKALLETQRKHYLYLQKSSLVAKVMTFHFVLQNKDTWKMPLNR